MYYYKQVYIILEGFETSLGINPSDPIIPFVLLLGTSTTLWYGCPSILILVTISGDALTEPQIPTGFLTGY